MKPDLILVDIVRQFLAGKLDAPSFVVTYQSVWKQCRDGDTPYQTEENANVFDRVFTAADCYSPTMKYHWEISAVQLKAEVTELEKLITG